MNKTEKTTGKKDLIFYIFDSDEKIINILTKLIEKIFPYTEVLSADNGEEGLNLLRQSKGIPIILADSFLPMMNGLQLLSKVRSLPALKEAYFIMLNTGNKDDNLKALKGGVDALLYKPVAIDDVIAKLKTASRIINQHLEKQEIQSQIEVINQEREEDTKRVKNMLGELQKARISGIDKSLDRVIKAADWIAKRIPDIAPSLREKIVNAARLSYIGRIYLPDKYIDEPVTRNGMISNPVFERIPQFSKTIASGLAKYEEEEKILYHIYENFDGSGFPDQLQSRQIHIGARIIRVAIDFEDLLKQHNDNYDKSLDELYKEFKRLYDFRVVAFYDQFLAAHSMGNKLKRESSIELKDLKQGLVLTRNIILESGIVLMGRGITIKDEHIEKIQSLSKTDPIIGDLYVQGF